MTNKAKKIDNRVNLFGLNLFSSTSDQLLKEVTQLVQHSSNTTYIVTPNSEQVVQAHQDNTFAQQLSQADYLVPDGVGLIWASRLLNWCGQSSSALTQRIAGVDVVASLLRVASEQQLTALVVGGRGYPVSPDSAKQSPGVQRLQLGQPSQQVWWLPAYETVAQPTQIEEKQVATAIATLQPDFVFVAFGAPWQEQWVSAHRQLLEANKVKLVMVVGGSFDYLTGRLTRAPRWIQLVGLEWLFRLVMQPWRWRRQLRLFQFVWITITSCWNGSSTSTQP